MRVEIPTSLRRSGRSMGEGAVPGGSSNGRESSSEGVRRIMATSPEERRTMSPEKRDLVDMVSGKRGREGRPLLLLAADV
jgi:hypothetical protein